jgi:putative membrane protein
MKTNRVLLLSSLLALGLVAATSYAKDDPNPKAKGFLPTAISAGIAEVKLGELAEKQSSNDDVKDFARTMIKDHTALNEKLMNLAKDAKLGVVQGLEKDQRMTMERLSKLRGGEFDRDYMKSMVEDHKKAVALFENEAKTTTNETCKSVCESALPTIREHLKKAQALSEKVNVAGR